MSSKDQEPAVVDFSEGKYVFGYGGERIKKSIYEKVNKIDSAANDIFKILVNELGEDIENVAAMLIAMNSETKSTTVRYIQSLCSRINDLYEEKASLVRIANGVNDRMVYLLGESELERFGL